MYLDHLVLFWIHNFNQELVTHLNGSQDLGLVFMLVIHLLMQDLLPWYSIHKQIMYCHNIRWSLMIFYYCSIYGEK
jgi:hypothetical protein